MCGIAGWLDYCKNLTNVETIRNTMISSMQHRGPDEQGIYVEKHINLMHTRLSILDKENGKQPFFYKQYVMVYNGEIYNCEEIKELLKEKYDFHTHCDSEVVIKAFDYWKEECVKKLNGIFSFFIWDKKNKKGFMARDRLGVKPFFYYPYEKGILFSSEIKTILAHPDVKAILTKDAIKEIFLLGPAFSSGKTILENIYELENAQYAWVDEKGIKKQKYWKLESKKHTDTIEETIKKVRELVCDSVKRQLLSDVGFCTFLSGGLDSSIISRIAIESVDTLDTYSIEYEENDLYFKKSKYQPNQDNYYINYMQKYLNSNHQEVIVTQKDIFEALKESTYAKDLPGMAEVDSSLLLFCREIKKKHSVALSGEGADEIFGGYPWYRDEAILWQEGFPWSCDLETRMSMLKDGIIENPKQYVENAYKKSIAEVEYLKEDSEKEKRMREMFYLNMQWFLKTLLDRKDRMSMYSGLEVRVPFLDYRLVEYAYNIPWEFKEYKGREKGILREAFKDFLPDEIINRKKSPYPKTHHPAYSTMLIEEIRTLFSRKAAITKFLDEEKVEKLIQNLDSMESNWYGQLMKGPQILAYFVQINAFLEKYDVVINCV